MEAYQILSLILTALSLAGVGTVCNIFWKDRAEKRKEKSQQEQARIKKQKQDDMREVITEELSGVNTRIEKLSDQMAKNTAGTIVLLRDSMKDYLTECKQQGWASTTDKALWNEMYQDYKNLGGNHFKEFVDQWKAEMNALPTGPDEQ